MASALPIYHRHYTPGHEQFITTCIYRRLQVFRSDRLTRHFVDVLRERRLEFRFTLASWVLMPEHFHVLLRPERAEATTLIVGSGVICETRTLPGKVIPAQAGIHFASRWKRAAQGMDSRLRGNDWCFMSEPISNDATT